MDIGEESKPYVIEPVESPVPAPAVIPEPEEAPVEEPERVKVPA